MSILGLGVLATDDLWAKRSLLLQSLVLLVASVWSPDAGAMVSRCGDCVCITWMIGNSAIVEVRCPADGTGTSGWRIGGSPPDGSDGSMGGNGQKKDPPGTLPGMAVSGALLQALTGARGKAITALRGTPTGEPGIFEPNDCTQMFDTSPMMSDSFRPIDLLKDYIIFRNGTGIKDSHGETPCNSVYAWTKCCTHEPIVILCPERFTLSVGEKERIAILLEETLHVAGQMEDDTGTVGPGDPPNPVQVRSNVKDACGLN